MSVLDQARRDAAAADRAAEELDALTGDSRTRTGFAEPESGTWPVPLDLREMARHDPEPPPMIIPDWLPCGYATMLAGHGGAGKSGIALQLAVNIALGLDWCRLPVEQRRVLYLSCEDRERALHWRLRRICDHADVDIRSSTVRAGWRGCESRRVKQLGSTGRGFL